MPLAIVSTVGSATANSYNSAAELDTASERVFPVPGWTDVDEPKQILSAVEATRLIDLMRHAGERVDDTQALEHPRRGVTAQDGRTAVLTTVIDPRVKLAHARLTFYLADQADGVDPFAPSDSAGVSAIRFGSELDMTFEKGATSVSAGAAFLANVIRPILSGVVYANQPGLVRG